MSLFDWWFSLPERFGRRVPATLKIVLLLWAVIGIMIALIPELQEMPAAARAILGAPAAAGILYVAIAVILKLVDRAVARNRSRSAN